MWVSKKVLEERRKKIKELYVSGLNLYDIAETVGVDVSTVYNSLSIAGFTVRESKGTDESKLVYADNKVVLQKVVINGKRYIDITPIFSPR